MKIDRESNDGHNRPGGPDQPPWAVAAGAASLRVTALGLYALAFGAFLGVAIVKFGNPVILDQKIPPPTSLQEVWTYAWPPHWAFWLLVPLALIGVGMGVGLNARWRSSRWLWILPATWLGWQFISATQTVDRQLTVVTLCHFAGCVACYFLGALALGSRRALQWLLIGVVAAFAFCLVRAVNQRLFEFPQERQLLVEGERLGWTNYAPEVFLEMKREGVIIATNGVDVANPAILAKYGKAPPPGTDKFQRLRYSLFATGPRVMGTLVYPNALAGAILLLLPISLLLAVNSTRRFRLATRACAIALTLFLGGAGLFWTGSKLGWLVAMAVVGVWLLRLDWPMYWKRTALVLVIIGGLALFAIRFHGYFAAGATSAGARFDYWRAAVQTAREHPFTGTGPGTFQHPYSDLKSPEAEMARLTHNDYLEQFSDSGIVGGVSYAVWIALSLAVVGRRLWRSEDPLPFAALIGLLGWFVQGLGEFSLYIPALAWTAFTLLGWLVTVSGNQIDKPRVPR